MKKLLSVLVLSFCLVGFGCTKPKVEVCKPIEVELVTKCDCSKDCKCGTNCKCTCCKKCNDKCSCPEKK